VGAGGSTLATNRPPGAESLGYGLQLRLPRAQVKKHQSESQAFCQARTMPICLSSIPTAPRLKFKRLCFRHLGKFVAAVEADTPMPTSTLTRRLVSSNSAPSHPSSPTSDLMISAASRVRSEWHHHWPRRVELNGKNEDLSPVNSKARSRQINFTPTIFWKNTGRQRVLHPWIPLVKSLILMNLLSDDSVSPLQTHGGLCFVSSLTESGFGLHS
jgi:hypothetical protein